MAHVEPLGLNALDLFEKGLYGLSADIDAVAQTCINKADPTLEAAYKCALSGVHAKAAHMSVTTPAKKNDLGNFSVSRPVGHSTKKPYGRYAMLAVFASRGVKAHDIPKAFGHGVAAKHPGLPGTGGDFVAAAASAAFAPCKQIIEQTFQEEAKKYLKEFYG